MTILHIDKSLSSPTLHRIPPLASVIIIKALIGTSIDDALCVVPAVCAVLDSGRDAHGNEYAIRTGVGSEVVAHGEHEAVARNKFVTLSPAFITAA